MRSKSRKSTKFTKATSGSTSDISNKAIVVALVLVVLVSVVSLGVYMRSIDEAAPDKVTSVSGTVEFTVVENPNLRVGQTDNAGGKVDFSVVKP